MAGGIDWFRWHHGCVTDPKFQLVARKSGAGLGNVIAVWAFILEAASANDDRGEFGIIDGESIDCMLGAEEGTTDRIISAMTDRGLISDGRIASWDKRQPKRERDDDDSTERVRRHRAAKKAAEQQAESADVTPCNAKSRQETPRGEERREEVNNLSVVGEDSPTTSRATAAPPPPPPESDASPTSRKTSGPPAKRASALPADFEPDATGVSYAEQRSVPLAVELQAFRNHHQARGSTMRDWQAAWRTWCDKAVEFGRCRAPPGSPAGNHRPTLTETRAATYAALTGRHPNAPRADAPTERDITGTATRVA